MIPFLRVSACQHPRLVAAAHSRPYHWGHSSTGRGTLRASLSRPNIRVALALAALLLIALALRLFLLAGPQTELDSDEAVVGLMANHILQGERPVFYYQQPYMGSLEAYLAALSFALLGGSTFALKLVPLSMSLLFVGLVFATGYRVGGPRCAFISGLYAAVPPAFLALWGLKARGGYIEVLLLGQALILLAMHVAGRGRVGARPALLGGLLTGIGVWTNLLIAVYLLPIALYLGLVLRRKLLGQWVLVAALAAVVGGLPLLGFNAEHGLATAGAMSTWRGAISTIPYYTFHFFRHSLPVLAGLAQGSTSQELFWPAFAWSLANPWPVALVLALLFVLPVALLRRQLSAMVLGRAGAADPRNLLVLLLVVVPAAFVITKFHEPVSEPRYLLPLYSAIPLLASGLLPTALPRRAAPILLAALIGLNLYSIAALDPVLSRPQSATASTPSNRQQLAEFLLARGLDRVYTDYWLAYPLAFESGERIAPSVTSGGFNRYIPYAYEVSVAPDPAFVFVTGSPEETAFAAKMTRQGTTAAQDRVSIYTVYSQVNPLDNARP
jgi:hypothetical protein